MPLHENGTQADLPDDGALFDDGAFITVVGESLVDIIDAPGRGPTARGNTAPEAHPGGSPLNVAVGCARLDLRTNSSPILPRMPTGR
jgi:fructokinase